MRQCLYTFVVIVCQFMLCSVWIGARYQDTESKYIWSKSGNEITFKNWATGSPKAMPLGFKCIRVFTADGEWSDFTCVFRLPFICEENLKWQTIAHSFLLIRSTFIFLNDDKRDNPLFSKKTFLKFEFIFKTCTQCFFIKLANKLSNVLDPQAGVTLNLSKWLLKDT